MATYVDFAAVINQIRAIFPNTGNLYFVDTDAGVDAAGRGTYALPLKTIDYTIVNYVTSDHNDVVLAYNTADGRFDENANNEGVRMSKANVTVIGLAKQRITNTKAGRTAVFTVTENQCRILGFAIDCSGVIGINGTWDYGMFGHPDFPMIIESGTEGMHCDGGRNQIQHIHMKDVDVGITLEESISEIHHINIVSTNAVGSQGIIIGAGRDSNYIHNNSLINCETGITLTATCMNNVIADNYIKATSNNIVNATAVGDNGIIHNHIDSQLGTDYTQEQDLAETDRQPVDFGRTGRIFYVKWTGNDANPGTYDLPFRHIDVAVSACVSARNDTVVVISNGFNHFDENVNADGVEMDMVGLNLVGINNPIIENSNMAATSVLSVSNRHNKIYNLTVRPSGAGVIGIYVQNMGCVMKNLRIYGGTATEIGILDSGGEAKIIDVEIDGVATGIDMESGGLDDVKVVILNVPVGILINNSSYNNIHDSVIVNANGGTAGINQTGVGSGNIVTDTEISGYSDPLPTVCGGTFLRNNIDRQILTHTITVAHGTGEQTAADLVLWTSGKLSVVGDMSDIVANEPNGTMVTLRLKAYVDDFTERLLDQKTFVLGSDTVYPVLTCPAGTIIDLNTEAQVTVQMSVAVGANRTLTLRQIMED